MVFKTHSIRQSAELKYCPLSSDFYNLIYSRSPGSRFSFEEAFCLNSGTRITVLFRLYLSFLYLLLL
ncbi:hypothetical protein L1887_32181 [Cichorium endivia]|nr:hypothetical protein L1887_32181 [Cichorium endivia]